MTVKNLKIHKQKLVKTATLIWLKIAKILTKLSVQASMEKSLQFGLTQKIWDGNYLKEKKKKTQGRIVDALTNEKVNLLQMQKLFGSLNDISLMCLFLQGFKKPLNNHLSFLLENNFKKQKLCDQAEKKDLLVFYIF